MRAVKNLSFTDSGTNKPVLKHLNFEIAESEIFGFLGPSGAGKSTTQKILYKILHKYEGEIRIKNKLLGSIGKEYYTQIGVGFELPNHYLKLTGLENLELFSSFYPKEKLGNLPSMFEKFGLEDSMNNRVETYSKGMKMRLNFIRAIMHDPDIMFFDEPTAGLDPGNAHIIKEHIRELKKRGKTIFITTHNMNTADELCDRVAFIVEGELLLTEAPAVLKHNFGKDLVRVESGNNLIKEFPLENLGNNNDFISFIKKNEHLRINTLEASLEEVFIKVTGKSLKS
jgi:fluoroquinolone transport system ATP-binding protein